MLKLSQNYVVKNHIEALVFVIKLELISHLDFLYLFLFLNMLLVDKTFSIA